MSHVVQAPPRARPRHHIRTVPVIIVRSLQFKTAEHREGAIPQDQRDSALRGPRGGCVSCSDPGSWHFQSSAVSNTSGFSVLPVLSLRVWEGQGPSLSTPPPGSPYYAWVWHFFSLPGCLSRLPAWSPVRTRDWCWLLVGGKAWAHRTTEPVPTRPSQKKSSWMFTLMYPLWELP